MGRKTTIIPRAPLARILENAGAKRVSSGGSAAFVHVLMEISEDIARKSIEFARHSGRKTIHEEDIRLAAK